METKHNDEAPAPSIKKMGGALASFDATDLGGHA